MLSYLTQGVLERLLERYLKDNRGQSCRESAAMALGMTNVFFPFFLLAVGAAAGAILMCSEWLSSGISNSTPRRIKPDHGGGKDVIPPASLGGGHNADKASQQMEEIDTILRRASTTGEEKLDALKKCIRASCENEGI